MAVGFGVEHIDRWAANPAALDALATRYGGTWLAVVVDLAVCVGAFVAAVAGVNLTARTVFAMAREGGMPRAFAWTHPRFGTPWAAIGAVLALTLALVLVFARLAWDDPFKYFGFMATTATFAILAAYILIALAGMVFFWRTRTEDSAFQIGFDCWCRSARSRSAATRSTSPSRRARRRTRCRRGSRCCGWAVGIVVLAWLMNAGPSGCGVRIDPREPATARPPRSRSRRRRGARS